VVITSAALRPKGSIPTTTMASPSHTKVTPSFEFVTLCR
jgi:hypothetical protein